MGIFRHSVAELELALGMIQDHVAAWQKSLPGQIRDDARGRAEVQAATDQAQRYLLETGAIPDGLPRALVTFGDPRQAPSFRWSAELTPEEKTRREKWLEDARQLIDTKTPTWQEMVQRVNTAVAPLKKGKWISAALMPWTGTHPEGEQERMCAEVEERGNEAVDEAIAAVIHYYEEQRR